jgi:hypothetical protein
MSRWNLRVEINLLLGRLPYFPEVGTREFVEIEKKGLQIRRLQIADLICNKQFVICNLPIYPFPKNPFFNTESDGFEPNQIEKSAFLNSIPSIVPFSIPFLIMVKPSFGLYSR